jgi:hypothetical protein
VQRISDDIGLVLSDLQGATHLRELGLEPVENSPEEFSRVLRAGAATWAKLITDGAITVD